MPTAGDTAASTALDSDGDATVTATPTTTGSGTKHYDITVDPAAGSASFDQSTGVLTYQAANGVSGVFTVKYTITSGGVTSAEHTATITVRPFAKDVTGSTDVNTAVTLPAPVALGSTPFTWTVATAPLHGSVTALNTATGAAVYEPAEGFAGDDSFVFELADGRGAATQVTVTVHVRPAAGDVSATTAASTSPAEVRIPLDGTGAIHHYEITTPLASSLGTAVIDGTDLVITPASGVSGALVVGYRAVDADGNVSAPATATLTVRPVAQGGSITVPSGGTASEALGAPVGSGPLTATVTAPLPAGILAASVDPSTGRITVATADDFSGTATITYTVTSGSGASAVTSDPATVTVTVDPTLVPAAPATTTATPAGAAPHGVTGSPKATGAGPRTWTLGTPATTSGPATPFTLDPAVGTATIDPASGQIVVTPAAGFSGPIDVPFTVTDGNGETRSGTFHVDVDPLTSATPGTGASRGVYGASQSYAPPAPVGTAPFTYRISTPPTAAQGTATIDPATGVITFVPAAGFHGVAEISYEVVDASGLVGAPAVVAFTVDPPATVAGLAHTGVDGILPLGLALAGLLAGLAMVLTVVRRRRLEQAEVPAAQA
ncbi:tandem-95 repeat protein [Schumannella sp. 10F1B-5-1]|nr:tandem-95 repeat protein [Schumannella sp. 10F1B-5-1]